MDYLKWILHCIKWQTYGECKIEAETQNWPFKITLKCGDESYDQFITPERIMIVLNDDNAMKALLKEIKVLFKIKKERFVEETFEMVRNTQSPLYYEFLKNETSPY